jgi:flagellar capping protein FliD
MMLPIGHMLINRIWYMTEYTGDDGDLNIDDDELDAILADTEDKSESFMQED